MGATGAGGDDWERKKGGREEGRPWGETKPSPGERFSRHSPERTTRQRHKSVLLSVKRLATFVWDGAI